MKKKLSILLIPALVMVMIPVYRCASAQSDQSSINDLDNQINMIARIIYHEARGESYSGKLAVGAVIVNRIESPLFPNTVEEVIYQPNAFSCLRCFSTSNDKPDYDCYRAACEAVMGTDPTNGCLFYYNPNTATSSWITVKKKHYTVFIDNHLFFR